MLCHLVPFDVAVSTMAVVYTVILSDVDSNPAPAGIKGAQGTCLFVYYNFLSQLLILPEIVIRLHMPEGRLAVIEP